MPLTNLYYKKYGRGAQIWTGDFLLPKQARYQAAPRPDYDSGGFQYHAPSILAS